MDNEVNPIDLPKLKLLIREGIEAIPVDKDNSQAIIVIGDTGVGTWPGSTSTSKTLQP